MNTSSIDTAELDLKKILRKLWQGRWMVIVSVLIATTVAVAYALIATPWYRAEVVFVTADSKSSGLNLGQLGGLASLAGISLPGAGANQAPLAVLQSREFVRQFINEKQLGPILFPETWSVGSGAQSADSKVPDVRDAVKLFTTTIRSVSEDKKSGLVTLSIRWKDPGLAASWANELISRVNDKLRAQALAESERNTRYLQQQMAETSVVALQQSIGRVLEAEMQKYLLAKGNPEFAFKVIDPATIPKVRDSPKRLMVVVLGAFFGFFSSCAYVLLRSLVVMEQRS